MVSVSGKQLLIGYYYPKWHYSNYRVKPPHRSHFKLCVSHKGNNGDGSHHVVRVYNLHTPYNVLSHSRVKNTTALKSKLNFLSWRGVCERSVTGSPPVSGNRLTLLEGLPSFFPCFLCVNWNLWIPAHTGRAKPNQSQSDDKFSLSLCNWELSRRTPRPIKNLFSLSLCNLFCLYWLQFSSLQAV